jgi:hypothetical protein
MRALLLAAMTMGCQSILGEYELGPTDTGGPATDSATGVDTNMPATDTPPALKSCKAIRAGGVTDDGPQPLGDGFRTFCDMRREDGGFTLVAMRSSKTDGSAWFGEAAVTKTKSIDGPDDDRDMILDISDWRQLGFTEVVYELGIDLNSGMRPFYGERVHFSMLDSGKQGDARMGLAKHVFKTDRPSCKVGTTVVQYCFGDMPAAGENPMQSYGWVFSPTGTPCDFAQGAKIGSRGCNTGKVGAARIWVR